MKEIKERTMNSFSNSPVPYYNHFLFKESLDLKRSLMETNKEYKNIQSRVKESLRKLSRLNHAEMENEILERIKFFQNELENSLKGLRLQDDVLFDLQKSLQSNKVYEESFQKSLRANCKMNLQSMKESLISTEEILANSENFMVSIFNHYFPNKIQDKSFSRINFDWLLNIPILSNFERRISR